MVIKKRLLKDYDSFHLKSTAFRIIPDRRNFTYRLLINFVYNNLYKNIKPQRKLVLDLGCGVGSISLFLASIGYDVTGIDVSTRAINAANKSKQNVELTNVNFELGDITKKSN